MSDVRSSQAYDIKLIKDKLAESIKLLSDYQKDQCDNDFHAAKECVKSAWNQLVTFKL